MDQVLNASSYLVKTSVDTTLSTLKPVIKPVLKAFVKENNTKSIQPIEESIQLASPIMSPWITIAGLMGATAVAFGAYGAHVVYPKDITDSRKAQFETANKYHFLHSLALIGVPLLKRPTIPGCLFIAGTLMFSGSCYHLAIYDDQRIAKITPIGGMTLIAAWLSMALLA